MRPVGDLATESSWEGVEEEREQARYSNHITQH